MRERRRPQSHQHGTSTSMPKNDTAEEPAKTILEIPGYFYDKEKKKYFKIQPGSSTSSSAYSSIDVKRRKLQDAQDVIKAEDRRKQQGRIRHAKILEQPLTGGFLSRSYGRVHLDASPILAAGFTEQGVIPRVRRFRGLGASRDYQFAITCRPCGNLTETAVWTGSTDYIRRQSHRMKDFEAESYDAHDNTYHTAVERAPGFWTSDLWGAPAELGITSSISINENHPESIYHEITAVTYSKYPTSSILIGKKAGGEQATLFTVDLGRPGREVDVFQSTAGSRSSDILFAFATNRGIAINRAEALDPVWITPDWNDDELRENGFSSIFAIEFLSGQHHNHKVLLTGSRKGFLNILDLRAPVFTRTSDHITHPSSVSHIRQINAHRIIVCGLQSSLCEYDLRYRKLQSSAQQTSNSMSLNGPLLNRKFTTPILTYDDYYNPSSWQHGFDVDLESGIIAAATGRDGTGSHPPVQLFSLHSGKVVRNPYTRSLDMLGEKERDAEKGYQVRGVQFARDVEGDVKSLFVGANRGIVRFAWAAKVDEGE